MKILAIKQPWASLIITGGTNVATFAVERKDIENRSKMTKYRGPLLVHASAKPDALMTSRELEKRYGVRPPDEQPVGGIIGITEILDCVETHPSKWYQRGNYAYVLGKSRPLPFIEWKGIQTIQAAPASLLRKLGL
ncbi:MAG: ASCH domain-containing protein [Bradyrhizobium sp.]